MTMKLNVNNEWGKLQEVVVGSVENANMPTHGSDLHAINYANYDKIPESHYGFFSQQIIEETHEDLEIFIEKLWSLNINVRRPNPIPTQSKISNGVWETTQYYTFCPRDSFTVIGETIIEAPMVLRSRMFENNAYKEIFIEHLKKGSRWVSAPKPMLNDELYQRNDLNKMTTLENEPVFDAANILRANKDILYLVSNTGNKLGGKWLQSLLGDEYKVHLLEDLYSYSHIDSTIALLREGLCLLNPERINDNNMPDFLKSWDKIWCPPMVDIDYQINRASKWIGLNLLSLDEKTVVVDATQTKLIKILEEKFKFDVITCKLRHSRNLGGSFHCITADIIRE